MVDGPVTDERKQRAAWLAAKTALVTILLGVLLLLPVVLFLFNGTWLFGIPAAVVAWWIGVQEAVWRFKDYPRARVRSELLALVSVASAALSGWIFWAVPPLGLVAVPISCWSACFALLWLRGRHLEPTA